MSIAVRQGAIEDRENGEGNADNNSEDRGRTRTAVSVMFAAGVVTGVVATMVVDVPSDDRIMRILCLTALALMGIAYITLSTRNAQRGIIEQIDRRVRAGLQEAYTQGRIDGIAQRHAALRSMDRLN
jgi:hypothetical protein